ncbi:hypothetical protein M011DRAFT_394777 [Sporormia fimetaria CBS 119925]|uniref:Alpha-1,2-mannosyltransferase n=1 Tax=Sporormia fimetaria CBS 119925 TaxID=1340428 RepID=A0A6A6VPU9_9PLEO|nr:hypothetical protein M011DRAFT_394777 [Sporormia fimetaria CBS 119925]
MKVLGAALFIGYGLFLLSGRRRRSILLDRISLRRRRVSGSKTPPRSLSPEKKANNEGGGPDYSVAFPPSRRPALESLRHAKSSFDGECHTASAQELANLKDKSIPMNASYLDTKTPLFTPCGFSTGEIRALGDSPDYATLSGVPLPRPYLGFDITRALPRPYRPFRWSYHQTMSLTKMEPDWWLEVENTYAEKIKQRQELFADHGKGVLQALPGSELACKEVMEMAVQFLCARYPQCFRLSEDSTVLYNDILGTVSNLKTTPPLEILLNNVPEDFALMLRDPSNGHYYFRAGVICSALGWNVATKIGLPLHEIHAHIPDYKEKMQFSMDRYFSKLPTDKPIQRGSWGLEVDQPLYMPPGHPHEKHRLTQHPDLDISRCHLRVDWQTLRRLPLSGAIVFNFKALFTPVERFREEPYIPALVLKVLKEGKRSIMEYKGAWHTEHVIIPALEKYAKEQVERGMVEEGWDERTLDESPWFPGWEEKWHREQGF